jgi:hypothetical protein
MLVAIGLEGMLIGELVWVDGVSISGEEEVIDCTDVIVQSVLCRIQSQLN